MANLNKVFLLGNLTRDPELRNTAQGTSVVNFDITVNRTYSKDGEVIKEVSFFKIVVWGRSADNCSKYLSKGRPVLVEGRLQNRHWEDQNGNKRQATEVVADNVQFLGSGNSNSGSQSHNDDYGDSAGENQALDDNDQIPF